MKPDFIFVGEGHGDPSLRPGRRGIAQVRFRQDEHASRFAQLDRRAQSRDPAANNGVIGTIAFVGVGHGSGKSAAFVW